MAFGAAAWRTLWTLQWVAFAAKPYLADEPETGKIMRSHAKNIKILYSVQSFAHVFVQIFISVPF
ncbi:MAG: hypothetical protein HFE86_09120 [Clostridiales bacterium]|nr:hypothetical protein [Clostridiales bacterium]